MKFALPMMLALFLLIPNDPDQDLVEEIWSHWERREMRISDIAIAYSSKIIMKNRRDDRGGLALFGMNGTVYCREDSKMKGNISGTYSTEEILLPDFFIRALSVNLNDTPQTKATLIDREEAVNGFGALSRILQLTRPSQIGRPTEYSVQSKSDFNGNECLVIQRKLEVDDWQIVVNLFLREDLDFLPVRQLVNSRRRGKDLVHMELVVSYGMVGGFNLPKSWVLRETFDPNGPESSERKTTCVLTSVEIGQEVANERIQIELPAGTELRDLRTDPESKEVLAESRLYSLNN